MWITNNCCYWVIGDVFTLSCAPVTIFVSHPHTFLPSLPWETASRLQCRNPGGAASPSTRPLAFRNSHDVTRPDQLFYFPSAKVAGMRHVAQVRPVLVLL